MILLVDEQTGARYKTGPDDNAADVPFASTWHVFYVVPSSWGVVIGEFTKRLEAGLLTAAEQGGGLAVTALVRGGRECIQFSPEPSTADLAASRKYGAGLVFADKEADALARAAVERWHGDGRRLQQGDEPV